MLKISTFIYNVKSFIILLNQILFIMMISYFVSDMKCYLWYQILFAMWTFIYDIKFCFRYQKIFNFKHFYMKENFL